jgi:hypothetical protein
LPGSTILLGKDQLECPFILDSSLFGRQGNFQPQTFIVSLLCALCLCGGISFVWLLLDKTKSTTKSQRSQRTHKGLHGQLCWSASFKKIDWPLLYASAGTGNSISGRGFYSSITAYLSEKLPAISSRVLSQPLSMNSAWAMPLTFSSGYHMVSMVRLLPLISVIL